MSSEDLLEKYEYWTGEDLGYKPSVFEKAKSEYFLWVWLCLITLKTKQIKIMCIIKVNNTNIWYTIRNIVLQGLKISMNLKKQILLK